MFGLAKQREVDGLRDRYHELRDKYWELSRQHSLLLQHLNLREETVHRIALVPIQQGEQP